ncbi:ABC-2 type transport system permease protein [Cytobacillus firmus]|uniref:ABC-2 type transport system permease protein n=2 Tax=Cytobacillus TaxID=2675230 RepID=A0A366JKE3_CYTFI|nr:MULTISPECIES: ABC transporter permease subunit [Cytobacillus]RBP87040.1 ABC-2 type transport system permease protein [Cytobacillus firmus]TDX46957.1 ABC-2 type transport system permease protein [Cytobacillus oceanisediminis]
MNQWMTLFKKEMLEMSRNFKWIWVPLTFIMIAVKEPLTLYYMPQIIDSLGGLPEGAVIELPVPSAGEALAASLSQFNTFGVLIIVLITMGTIAGERKSGVAGLILVKPVSYAWFVTAKWASSMILIWISYFLSYFLSWYYVGVLFEFISFMDFLQSFFVNGIWLTLIVTVVILFNTFMKSPGAVGFISIGIIVILSILSSSLPHLLEWSPALLSAYANAFIMGSNLPDELLPSIIVSVIMITLSLLASIAIFKRRELA